MHGWLAYLVWDPDPALFRWDIPLLGRPLLWYGALFALGFFLGYALLERKMRLDLGIGQKEARKLAESLSGYAVVGVLVGARLFDVVFYQDWMEKMRDPLSLFAVWEGGLASH